MDAKTFLDNFATIAEAPGGIQRLRDLVLELAVSGQLVAQNPSDEPAGDGLADIRSEKGDTLANSIRGGASVPRIPESSATDRALPAGWERARIDDTGEYVNGLAFKNSDWKSTGTPIVRIQNLTNPLVPFNFADGPFPEDRMVQDGDILVSWSATLNAFRWDRGAAVVNQHIFKVIPDHRIVTADFLFHLLRHCIREMAEGKAAHGLVMKHINRGPFLSHVVAIPPLAEQERIVAKVDELMDLCDDLEARQEHRRRSVTHFRTSALHALTEADTPEDLRHAWERVRTNWTALTDHPDSAAAFRQTVLNLAFAGHLTAVSPGAAEKRPPRRGTSAGPFPTPGHWQWAEVGDVTDSRLGKMLDKAKNTGPMRPYLRNANVQWFRFDLTDVHELRLEDADLEAHVVRAGDLVVCEGGEPGRVAICDDSVDGMVFQKALHRVRPGGEIDVRYLAYLMRCYADSGFLSTFFTGATIKHLTGRSLRTIPVPLPPLDEQHQIVRRINQLTAACNEVEAGLAHSLATQEAVATRLTECRSQGHPNHGAGRARP